MTDKPIGWRNRIVAEGEQPASQFVANPRNWRRHPQAQRDAMRGSLNEVGWVQRVVVNRRTGNLVDGHERVWQALQNDDAMVPYVEVDLSEQEEVYVLATLDPIGAMAAVDAEALNALLHEVETSEASIQAMLGKLAADSGITSFDPMAEWQGMPEFQQEDKTAFQSIHVHFKNQEDIGKFAALIGQKITPKTRSLWYPEIEIERYADKRYIDES